MTSAARPHLVASDLDGTLLAPDGQVSERTTLVLRRVRAAGVEVVAATGRSHRTAGPRLEPTGAVRWAVCSNGASLYDVEADEVVLVNPFPGEVTDALFGSIRELVPGCGLGWETIGGFDFDPAFHELRPQFSANRTTLDLPRQAAPGTIDVLKVMLVHPELVSDELLAEVTPHLPDGVYATCSGAQFIELMAEGVDKAAGLAHLCERLGIESAAVVAFGDQLNDLPMLAWAGRGVAMANAHPEVLGATDHRAQHHADDGVATHLEDLLDLV
ncbi:MAG: HAD family hydrolase [Actinomycetia bacterium]|nr:HAD family hydrolase [Actinomycetes bacterium]